MSGSQRLVGGDENVLELDTAEGTQLCKYTKCH